MTSLRGLEGGRQPAGQPSGNGGGGGDNSVGERLARLEARLDAVATREDLAKMETRILKWGITLLIGSVSLALAIAKFF